MSSSVVEILSAVAAAREVVPDLRVVVASDCLGRQFLLDVCCSRIYISRAVPGDEFGEVLIAALAGLVTRARPNPADAPLIPAPRSVPAEHGRGRG